MEPRPSHESELAPAASPIDGLVWPSHLRSEVVAALARRSGLTAGPRTPDEADTTVEDEVALTTAAAALGVEVEPVAIRYAEVETLLSRAAPALFRVATGWLALVRAQGRRVWLLGPDLRVRAVALAAVDDALCGNLAAARHGEIKRLVALLEVPERRRLRARRAMAAAHFRELEIGTAWLVRTPPDAPWWRQASDGRLVRHATVATVSSIAMTVLGLAGWWLIGRGALNGRLETPWLVAWLLILLALVLLQVHNRWATALLGMGTGVLLKRRLLAGALRIDLGEVRFLGTGQLLGRVIESETIEALALGTAFSALMALVDLALAAGVLALGAGGTPHAVALLAVVGVTLTLGLGYYRAERAWTMTRLDMTHGLVERMVGYRTRLVQQRPARWHLDEDRQLAAYLEASRRFDERFGLPLGLLGRGWLLLGVLMIAPPFLSGTTTPATLALAFGGTLLGGQALNTVTQGLTRLSAVVIAWRVVGPLFRAGGRSVPPPEPAALGLKPPSEARPVVLDAQGMTFRHRPGAAPVFSGVDLQIRWGERVLLGGASGAGKSTLAHVVAGLSQPESGLVLVGGLDRQTLGQAGWRARVAAAPQFHDNYILNGTLAFNLLMARAWPPRPEDLEEAGAICDELGLGPLLERMPSGLQQLVGESGWQLSHGERSRVYLARALLQRAELVVLDESFAALDPETLEISLRCALRRAPALLVIAHP